MPWIPVKHPIIWAFSTEAHQVQGGVVPPGPPTAPLFPYFIPRHQPFSEKVFGKWTDASSMGDGMGICLWQHDWGPPQVHVSTPNVHLAVVPFGATLKLQLPASTTLERATGGLMHAGTSAPVAAATSVGYIVCQTCWDRNGSPFIAPTGHHISAPSTIQVDVRLGDIFAAVLGMASDLLATKAGAMFGNMFGNVGSSLNSLATAVLGAMVRTKAMTFLIGFTYTALSSGDVMAYSNYMRATRTGQATFRTAEAEALAARSSQAAARTTRLAKGTGLIVGSIACDWAAESVQGSGSKIPAPF